MKNHYWSIVVCLALLMATAVQAQEKMDKEEAAQWKKRIRALKPEEFKALVEERDRLRNESQASQSKIASLESSLAQSKNEIATLKEQLADKDSEIEKMKEKAAMAAPVVRSNAASSASTTATTSIAVARPEPKSMAGVVFKVQVGAFRNKDLTKYFDNNPNFSGEVDADGQKKYTLGHFTDYWEADTFKKYLREMGVKDAWIVAYKDGKRVPIKDVLEGVVQ